MRLDSRPIYTDAEGIKLSRVALGSGANLCDFCSIHKRTCELPPSKGLERCGPFVPALSFVPPLLGLDGEFSTFRGSSVWYDRAKIVHETHGQVGLFNAETKDLIGYAQIIDVIRGPFGDLMRDYAWTNHLARARGLSKEAAAEWLPRAIRNLAGKRYVKSDAQICTVIHLERL